MSLNQTGQLDGLGGSVVVGEGTAGTPVGGVLTVQGASAGILNTKLPNDLTTTGTIVANGGTVQADGAGQPYTTVIAELSGTFSAATNIAFEQSTDGVTWYTQYVLLANTVGASPNNSYNGGSSLILRGLIGGVRFVRAHALAFQAADSVAVKLVLSASDGPMILESSIPTGSNVIGAVTQNILSLVPSVAAVVTAGITSGVLVSGNASRKGLIVTNTSSNRVSLNVLNATAVLGSGITLYPGWIWEMDQYSFTINAINVIASAASSTVAIQEFS